MSYIKLYRYVDHRFGMILDRVPLELNYKTHLNRSLFPKRTFIQGELQSVEWFAEFNQTTGVYSDTILKVDITYTRDAAGFALSRDTIRTWIKEDDSEASQTKVTKKYYEGKDRDLEGIRRRGNIVAQIKVIISAHLMFGCADPTDYAQAQAALDTGRTFYEERETEADRFMELSRQDIYDSIIDSTLSPDTWLDEVLKIGHDGTDPILHPGSVTARQAIVAELNIWDL